MFLVLFTLELLELDPEKTERTELLHKDQDSTGITKFLQQQPQRKLCKYEKKNNINQMVAEQGVIYVF